MRQQGDEEPGPAADRIAGQHPAHEGLDEILGQYRQRGGKTRRNGARRRHQHGRHAEAAHRDLPQVEQNDPEGERYREVEGATRASPAARARRAA